MDKVNMIIEGKLAVVISILHRFPKSPPVSVPGKGQDSKVSYYVTL